MIHRYKLSEEVLHFIVAESQRQFPCETGGILVGKVENRCVFIRYAIGPGENAQHTPSRFKRDGNFGQEHLDTIVSETSGEYDYVGEWHSHPVNSRLSFTDVESMHWIANNNEYATHPSQLKASSDLSGPKCDVFTLEIGTDMGVSIAQRQQILALCHTRVLKL